MVTSTDTNIAITDEMTLTGRKTLRVKRFSDYDTVWYGVIKYSAIISVPVMSATTRSCMCYRLS